MALVLDFTKAREARKALAVAQPKRKAAARGAARSLQVTIRRDAVRAKAKASL